MIWILNNISFLIILDWRKSREIFLSLNILLNRIINSDFKCKGNWIEKGAKDQRCRSKKGKTIKG
jgi:hypothetical protein